MNTYYPILLKLEGKRCVVIGGGWGTESRVRDLLSAGAQVTLVSPESMPGIEQLACDNRIQWEPREFRPGDLRGAFLVVVCPHNRMRNPEIWAEAEAEGIPINAIDDSPHCTFIFPAIHRQGDLVIAVSSSGKSPAMAARVRDRIARKFGPEYGKLLDLLGEFRPEFIKCQPSFKRRRLIWHRLLDSKAINLIKAGKPEEARAVFLRILEEECLHDCSESTDRNPGRGLFNHDFSI
jgi:siroheme synthase-like protein